MLDSAIAYAHAHADDLLSTLMNLLRIPSVSSSTEFEGDLQRIADWLTEHMQSIGMTRAVQIESIGHPVVFGEWVGADESLPTLIVYGHYDVQPADPVSEWLSEPFEPTVRGDDLYCRGASDDKGQFFTVLSAVESYLATSGRLPINLKIILEGEEELASPNIGTFVERNRDLLRADSVLIADDAMVDKDTPALIYGTRGIVYMEVELVGPSQDLHSGIFGGAVDNPHNVLVQLLAALRDPGSGRVTVPGFYDRVRDIDRKEHELLTNGPFTDMAVLELTGVPNLAGEQGYSAIERVSIRPTLDVRGIGGGFVGPGEKTVIPARAFAKVSMRLVPDQDPREIADLFTEYIRSLTPPTVSIEVHRLGLAPPTVIDTKSLVIEAAARALETTFHTRPVFLRRGGTLPVMQVFHESLDVPIVLTGFGLLDDNIHAPNEKLYLPNFYRGVETVIRFLAILGAEMDA